MSLDANYLCAEDAIIAQLRAAVPELVFIDGSRSVQEVVERAVPLPAALVLYGGDTLKESAGFGADQVVLQKWVIELVVRNDYAYDSGSGERSLAGLLLSKVIKALSGWNPTTEHREMVRAQAANPVHPGDGMGYYQLAFYTEIVT